MQLDDCPEAHVLNEMSKMIKTNYINNTGCVPGNTIGMVPGIPGIVKVIKYQ